jgi:fatty-acyl-CoA synthase
MTPVDPPRILPQLLSWQAALRGSRPACTFNGRTQSYAELNAHANQVAHGLLAGRLSPEARVGVLAKNSDLFVEIMFGVMKAGAVFLPVNWRLAAPEIRYILEHGQVEWLFVEPEFSDLAEAARDGLSGAARILVMDPPQAGLDAYTAWRDAQSDRDPGCALGPDDVVLQMYTSGTTGLPKGVQLTNENFASSIDCNARPEAQAIAPDATVFSSAPFFHLNGVIPMTRALHAGARLLTVTQFRADEAVELMVSERVTRAGMAPAMIQMCLQVPGVEDRTFPDLKLITYGGSPISEAVLVRAMKVFGCGFSQSYGMTEACGAVVNMTPGEHLAGGSRLQACGRPLPGAEVQVVDAHGRPCPPREVGEVVIRGPMVMKGYWRDPEATARTIRDGWLHSGDAGYVDEDGFLHISDRIKEMIVSGAENVYPAEVENAVAHHPAVADVAVIGVPDERWGEAVKALVVLRPGAEATPQSIIAEARRHIAGYKLPKSVDFVGEIPRNATGKILRRDLRAPYWEGAARQVN